MNLKSTLRKLSLFLLLILCISGITSARPLTYCAPTFANGCGSWNNQSIVLGSINWTNSGTCTDNDYTSSTTTLNAGASYAMTVTNGNWCGCSVWIDFNNDQNFDTIENVFHTYVGGSPSYTYNFNIDIPASVPTGSYRMRVIGAWGSDGYTSGSGNGFGPCGAFQYGNYDDFTVDIVAAVGIANPVATSQSLFEVSPNPATSLVTVTMKYENGNDANLVLTDIAGKIIRSIAVTKEKEVIDISDLAKGVYMMKYTSGSHQQSTRLVK